MRCDNAKRAYCLIFSFRRSYSLPKSHITNPKYSQNS